MCVQSKLLTIASEILDSLYKVCQCQPSGSHNYNECFLSANLTLICASSHYPLYLGVNTLRLPFKPLCSHFSCRCENGLRLLIKLPNAKCQGAGAKNSTISALLQRLLCIKPKQMLPEPQIHPHF